MDTASHYHNEEKIGEAVRDSQIPREKLWITSKLWIDDFSRVQEACEESLKRLQIEYLDLFLIHRPSQNEEVNKKVFENLLELKKQKKVKKI
ncbi:aldo/keto reductase [bacterium]|nr:aldo/keto reductase [bacterium]